MGWLQVTVAGQFAFPALTAGANSVLTLIDKATWLQTNMASLFAETCVE
jgi:hypothetical protein